MNKWYQGIVVHHKEIDNKMYHCFDDENFKILNEERNEQLKEIERLQKENQILMNSMVTEAHTKETKEIERLNNIIGEAIEYIEDNSDDMHTYISQAITQILKGSDSNVKD